MAEIVTSEDEREPLSQVVAGGVIVLMLPFILAAGGLL